MPKVKLHPALKVERHGRGKSLAEIAVFDLALLGKGAVFHVIGDSFESGVCGASGKPSTIERDVDARTIALRSRGICVRCLTQIGPIPPPNLVAEGGLLA